jgi:hypothetical protein
MKNPVLASAMPRMHGLIRKIPASMDSALRKHFLRQRNVKPAK